SANSEHDFKAAFRGDLVQAIIERGTLEALDVSEVVCRLRARDPKTGVASTIKWLAADGALVKKGQRILELDDSGLREQLGEQKLKLDQAEAALIQAKEAQQVAKKELQIETRLGDLNVRLAKLELKKQVNATKEEKEILEVRIEQAQL